ncbi:hypothetical protein Drose_16875 [Dactylosporangium roseum]|uniref:Uncharacterized protein n=1 Tax=Dactylosporangium roseum TaxID=47989 RepID=A0ABY5ZCB1_9ACTN|nr:hypothetical protein [Dactylosporangium roseum]UWZ39740.1 hypothetical protein Drose_16875 [Dactylosporangium roseum]
MPGTKERLIEVVSTAAGAADPKTGLAKAKSKVMSTRTVVVACCLLVTYLAGRRAACRGRG